MTITGVVGAVHEHKRIVCILHLFLPLSFPPLVEFLRLGSSQRKKKQVRQLLPLRLVRTDNKKTPSLRIVQGKFVPTSRTVKDEKTPILCDFLEGQWRRNDSIADPCGSRSISRGRMPPTLGSQGTANVAFELQCNAKGRSLGVEIV